MSLMIVCRRLRPVGTALIAGGMTAGVAANDSTAELATGGLVLTRSSDVEMASEDLFLSVDRVRVVYGFVNHAARPISAAIAFPLPDLRRDGDEDATVPTDDPVNPFAFRLLVDGIGTPVRLEQHAMIGRIDRAPLLARLKVPLVPTSSRTLDALDRLSPDDRAALRKWGVASDGGQGHLLPAWTLRSTYYWNQTFPPGRTVKIEHDYRPSVGGASQTGIGTPGWQTNRGLAHDFARFCPDAGLVGAVTAAMRSRRLDYPPFGEQRLDYVLHTGANWRGPIGRFHLTIDKGDAAALLSTCMTGLAKTGPTRFETTRTGFVPSGDLKLLLLVPQ